MFETLTESGVAVYYRSIACIPGRRARIGRIFLRVSYAHCRFMRACTHASLFWLFAPGHRAGYDRRGTINWIFFAG